MKEVKFYVTSDISWYRDFSVKIGKALGSSITILNNTMALPKPVGDGRFEFFELEEGLGILKTYINIKDSVKFKLLPHQSNDYLILHINLRPGKSYIVDAKNNKVHIGKNWDGGIFCSSSGAPVEIILPHDEWAKSITLIIHRIWMFRHLGTTKNEFESDLSNIFFRNGCLQCSLELNIDILKIAEEIQFSSVPSEWKKVQLKGQSLKLLSYYMLAVSNYSKHKRLDYKDVMRIISLKEKMQETVNQIWPKTEVAAKQCMMSRSKFLRLFKIIYDRNYYDLYQDIRMQKAAEMLERGSSVAETSREVGFVNTSHFSKVFKDHFFIEPSLYKN